MVFIKTTTMAAASPSLAHDSPVDGRGRGRMPAAMAMWWSLKGIATHHPIPCLLAVSLFFFMGVEYTLEMVPPSSPPTDMGFLLTQDLHVLLRTNPALNSFLAASNTVFVVMQAAYIVLWALVVEGRPRPTIAALFMFTCRGLMGYCTQLPLPHEFLGSGVDFPPGNMSFFLFFSGHVAGAIIASRDMRRMRRHMLASAFDYLNALQALRLLAARGHYTIDLAVGIAAGFFFDILAGKYQERNNVSSAPSNLNQKVVCSSCNCR